MNDEVLDDLFAQLKRDRGEAWDCYKFAKNLSKVAETMGEDYQYFSYSLRDLADQMWEDLGRERDPGHEFWTKKLLKKLKEDQVLAINVIQRSHH